MKKPILSLVLAFMLVLPTGLYAESAQVDTQTQAELLLKIKDLKEIVRKLTEELHNKIFDENKDFRFDRSLSIGSRGLDVEKLQTFLADNTQFYPEGLITGYYGVLTDHAIERLKNEYQIVEDSFGHETQRALNKLFQEKSAFVVSTSGFALSPIQINQINGDTTDTKKAEEISTTEIARDINVAINKIRVKNGLNALTWDNSLANVALSHSLDQARDNKELTDPELLCQYPIIRHEGFISGFGVRDRVINAGVDFRSVGENIAMIPGIKSRSYTLNFGEKTPECPKRVITEIKSAVDEPAYRAELVNLLNQAKSIESVSFVKEIKYTENEIVDLAVNGWMDSPGHRENILYKDFTDAGIGVVKVNEYYIITHNFVGR